MASPTIPKTMKACQVVVFHKPPELHIIPVPDPSSLGPYDLLLKTAVASLCHTDLMVLEGVMGSTLPLTGSHEGTGTVAAKGSSVPDSEFKIGDRVLAGIPRNRCQVCDDCRSVDAQYCSVREGAIGITVDGAFAEYLVADSRDASIIPDALDFVSAAPLACAGVTVWRGVIQAQLKEGQWLGIVGSGGGLGHLGIQFAKKKGLKVVGVDARDEGLELSRKVSADVVLDARNDQEEVVKAVLDATDGKGVAASIVLSEARSAAGLACAITMKHGRITQIAQPSEIVILFRELIFRDIKIVGSLTGSRKQTGEMLEFAAKNGINVETNVYYGLDKVPQMIEESHHGRMKGKSVVVVDESLQSSFSKAALLNLIIGRGESSHEISG